MTSHKQTLLSRVRQRKQVLDLRRREMAERIMWRFLLPTTLETDGLFNLMFDIDDSVYDTLLSITEPGQVLDQPVLDLRAEVRISRPPPQCGPPDAESAALVPAKAALKPNDFQDQKQSWRYSRKINLCNRV